MSIIVNADGGLEVGPPEDNPVRKGHARLVRAIAWELEMNDQMMECHSGQIKELLRRVSELEQMIIGPVAVPVVPHPFFPPERERDACIECGHPEAVHAGWPAADGPAVDR